MDVIKDTGSNISIEEPQPNVGEAHTPAGIKDCEGRPRLFNVPLEIVQEIVSYLDTADLLNFALVSWKANEFSVEKLYEKIIFTIQSLGAVVRSSHPLFRTDVPNRNLRHVRSVGVKGGFEGGLENAGHWLADLPVDSLEAISISLWTRFENFICRLEPGSLREIIWQTELIFCRTTYKILAESQKNINSIELGRLSILGPIKLVNFHPGYIEDNTLVLAEYCYELLTQETLVSLKVEEVRGFRELGRLVEVIYRHRHSLKRVAIKMPSFETGRSRLQQKIWDTSTFEHALAICGISLTERKDIFLPKVESLKLSGFKLSEAESADLSSLLGPILDLHRVCCLKTHGCGHLSSIIWPQLDTPTRLTVLHIDAYGITDRLYNFLENTETSCRLVELKTFIWTQKEERFPNLQHHAGSLQRLFLVMVKQVYRPIQCPITTESWQQLMEMPRLTELAITLPNTPAQPMKISMHDGAFPSLRALWIMTPDIHPDNSVPFIYFEKEDSTQGSSLGNLQKTYPKNLELIGLTMRHYTSIPERFFVRWQENKPSMATYLENVEKPKYSEHEYDFLRIMMVGHTLFEIFQMLM
ncbi:hypothetical protein AA313_de0206259 [Arthrobotrys entomopaga]|nr:hypothetical protein AA313_de0206259 [Arthrobotrys entomopaga]